MQSIQLVLLALVSLLCVVKAQNYCDSNLCHGRQHIGCRNSGVRAWMLLNYADKHHRLPTFVQLFYNSCPSDRHLVRLSKEQKQTILNTHNFFRWLFDVQTRNTANIDFIISWACRNKIASGSIKGFCSASRMATMVRLLNRITGFSERLLMKDGRKPENLHGIINCADFDF